MNDISYCQWKWDSEAWTNWCCADLPAALKLSKTRNSGHTHKAWCADGCTAHSSGRHLTRDCASTTTFKIGDLAAHNQDHTTLQKNRSVISKTYKTTCIWNLASKTIIASQGCSNLYPPPHKQGHKLHSEEAVKSTWTVMLVGLRGRCLGLNPVCAKRWFGESQESVASSTLTIKFRERKTNELRKCLTDPEEVNQNAEFDKNNSNDPPEPIAQLYTCSAEFHSTVCRSYILLVILKPMTKLSC